MTHTITIIAPLLLADTVYHTSHGLLLLVQLSKLVTTAHEQTAIERAACWKLNICQFERGVDGNMIKDGKGALEIKEKKCR